jgi:hypothetical protein
VSETTVQLVPTAAYTDVPMQVYRDLDAINASLVSAAAERSAMHAAIPGADSEAKDFGTTVHLAILEPHVYDTRLAIIPAINAKSSTERAKRDADMAERPEALWLSDDDAESIVHIRAAVRAHKGANALTRCKGPRELTLVWKCGDWVCKGRLDKLAVTNNGERVVVDLKTTRNAESDAFARDAIRLGYHRKAAWYCDGVEAVYGSKPARFYIIAVESEEPHAVTVHEFDEDALEAGRRENVVGWNRVIEAKKTGVWAGYPDCVFSIGAPAWLRRKTGMESA